MLASALLISVLLTWVYAADWSYSGINGPDHWGSICQLGKKQSPINLERSSAKEGRFHDIVLFNYHLFVTMNITNNGHTVRLDVEQPCSMLMAAGGLPALFKLEQIHFHWPSEHTLDGHRWPLEIHLVHYDSKYSSILEAVKHRWGVAVLAILYHEDDKGGQALSPLLRAVGQVGKQVGTTTRLPTTQAPSSFLPQDTTSWYRYEGSLTTPNCNEGVIWTVLRQSLPVSQYQIGQFQEIISSHGRIRANNRPIQALNDRTVYLQDGHWNPANAGIQRTVPSVGSVSIALVLLHTLLA